jgi:hypothetical protein
MKAIRPTLGIAVQAATIAATIFSTSVTAAEVSPNSAEWPSGDGWIIQVGSQEIKRAAHDWEIPDSPLLPDAVTPKTVISVPTEFKFNVTLTIRHNDKSLGNHRARARPQVGPTHCGDVARGAWRDACPMRSAPRAMNNYASRRLSPWLGHIMVSRQETARLLLTPDEVMLLPPATNRSLSPAFPDPGREGPVLRGSAPCAPHPPSTRAAQRGQLRQPRCHPSQRLDTAS